MVCVGLLFFFGFLTSVCFLVMFYFPPNISLMSLLSTYISSIQREFDTWQSTEHSFRPALKTLLESLSPAILALNESQRIVGVWMPDFTIKDTKDTTINIGRIEAKDLWVDLDEKKNADQLGRYLAAFDNFVYTNNLTFQFYRQGKRVTTISLGTATKQSITWTGSESDFFSSRTTSQGFPEFPRADDHVTRQARPCDGTKGAVAQVCDPADILARGGIARTGGAISDLQRSARARSHAWSVCGYVCSDHRIWLVCSTFVWSNIADVFSYGGGESRPQDQSAHPSVVQRDLEFWYARWGVGSCDRWFGQYFPPLWCRRDFAKLRTQDQYARSDYPFLWDVSGGVWWVDA